MKKILFIIFLVSIIFGSYHYGIAAKKDTVAVIDFAGQNVSAMDAIVVTDFLRTALVNNAYFEVVDRGNMEKILAEQGFQQTGCTTQECAVKIGNLLNVQKIIMGSLSRLGETYYITANIVDIETGKIVTSDRVKSRSQSELDFAMEKLAKRLEAKSEGKKIEPEKSRPPIAAEPSPPITQIVSPSPVKTTRGYGKPAAFGIGVNLPGVSLKMGIYNRDNHRSACVEFKFQYEDSIPVYGLRIHGYLNKNKLILFYLGGEVGYTGFTSGLVKVRGGIVMPYIGAEFFATKSISVQFDIGPAFYMLKDINFDVSVKGYELAGNIGITLYFGGF